MRLVKGVVLALTLLLACGPTSPDAHTDAAGGSDRPQVQAATGSTGGLAGSLVLAAELRGVARADVDAAPEYTGYMPVEDVSGAIQIEVPQVWADTDGRLGAGAGGRTIADVRAAPDLAALGRGWDTPGVIVNATSQRGAEDSEATLLDELTPRLSAVCEYQGRRDYPSRAYSARYDLYTDCGRTGAAHIVVGAAPGDRSWLMRVRLTATTDRDLAALDHVLNTFKVIGAI